MSTDPYAEQWNRQHSDPYAEQWDRQHGDPYASSYRHADNCTGDCDYLCQTGSDES